MTAPLPRKLHQRSLDPESGTAPVTPPAAIQGESLLPLTEKTQPTTAPAGGDPDRPVFSSWSYASRTFGVSELRSWRAGKYFYVQAPKRELYNVSDDPVASKNLATTSKAVADALDGKLSEFLARTSRTAGKETKLDPMVVQKLRAWLRYFAGNRVSAMGQSPSTPCAETSKLASIAGAAALDASGASKTRVC